MSDQPVSTNGHHREPPAPAGALVALLGGCLLATTSLVVTPGVTAAPPALVLAAGGGLAVLLAALAFRLAANRSLAFTALAWLGLIAWGATSTPGSLDRYLSEVALISWVGGLAMLMAFGLGTPVARFWRAGALLLVLAASALALFGLWLTLPDALSALQQGQALPRLSATFTNPDCLAAVLAVAMVLVAGLAGSAQGPLALPLLVCSGVLLTGLLFTGSRAGLVGLLAGLATYGALLFMRRDEEGRRAAVLGLAPPVLMALLLLLTQFLTPALGRWGALVEDPAHQGLAMRQAVVRDGLKCAVDRPLLGSGPGTFHLAFQEHRPPGLRAYVNVAHNDYMQVLVETGILGFALFLIGLGVPILRAGRCALSGPFPAEAAAGAGAAVSVAVYAGMNFALPVPADLFWWCAALGLCLSDSLSSHRPRGASALAVAPAALMLAVCGVGAVLLGLRMDAAAREAAAADRLARTLRWEQAAQASASALAREPLNPAHHLRMAHLEERQARLAQDPALLEKARQRAELAHRLSPSNVPNSLELARLRREAGDLGAAEELLLGLRSTAPHDLRVDAELAGVYLRHGRLPEAAQALWRASLISQNVSRGLAVLVAALEEQRAGDGTQLLRQWVAERREDGLQVTEDTIIRMRSLSQAEAMERVMALRSELDPSNVCGALEQAELALRNKQVEKARAALRRILSEPPAEGEGNAACHRRATERFVALELQEKRYDDAQALVQEQLQARPWEGWLRVLLADVYVARGQGDEARKVLREGLNRRSTDADLLARLGQLYESQGVAETALRYYRDALRNDPDNHRVAEMLRRLEQKQDSRI